MRQYRGEVHVVKQLVPGLVFRIMRKNPPDHLNPMSAGGLERVIRLSIVGAIVLRQRNCWDTLQSRFHRAAQGAGVEGVFSRVVAAVHARQHQIGGSVFHDVMQACQHAIGGAAFGCKTTRGHLADHHRVRVADAMADAGLFKRRCNGPNLAVGASDLLCNLGQNFEPRCVNPVVIGDENTHLLCPVVLF